MKNKGITEAKILDFNIGKNVAVAEIMTVWRDSAALKLYQQKPFICTRYLRTPQSGTVQEGGTPPQKDHSLFLSASLKLGLQPIFSLQKTKALNLFSTVRSKGLNELWTQNMFK